MVRVLWITVFHLLRLISAYRAITGSATSSESSFWEAGGFTAKLWTWNSGVKNLGEEAESLSRSSEDLLVTCQTEGKTPIKHDISQDWVLIAHGEHWGMTGMSDMNAQILSVFVRKPTSPFAVQASEAKSTVWEAMGNAGVMMVSDPDEAGQSAVLRSLIRVHRTSSSLTGKGGVSASLVLEAKKNRERVALTFLCAHLDSEKDELRTQGLVDMMLDLKASSRATFSSEVLDDKGALKRPCALWDASSDFCESQLPSTKETDPEVLLVLGDVNYRLFSEGLDNLDPATFLDPVSRSALARNDPLIPASIRPSPFVVPVEKGGFGFECNQPFQDYLPTYKRAGGDACAKLGLALLSCGGPNQPECGSKEEALFTECYPKKEKKGKKVWATKGDYFQLGWLDRFCFRTINSPNLSVSLVGNQGWSTTPGIKDKKQGSDHMPVAVTLRVDLNFEAHVDLKVELAKIQKEDLGCPCPLLSEQQTLFNCSKSEHLEKHQFDTLSCSEGYRLVDTSSAIRNSLQDVKVQCDDGEVNFCEEGTCEPLSRFQCIRTCGSYQSQSTPASIPGHTLGIPEVVAGGPEFPLVDDTITLTCTDSVMIGDQELVCTDTGAYMPASVNGLQPICLPTCDLRYTSLDAVQVTSRAMASSDLLSGPYGSEIQNYWERLSSTEQSQKLLLGGHLALSCGSKCVLPGSAQLTCEDSEPEPTWTPKCACSLAIHIRSISSSSPEFLADVKSLKIQVFEGFARDMQGARKNKAYVASAKFPVQAVLEGGEGSMLSISDLPRTALHLTVCSKTKGSKKNLFSSCRVRAETDYMQGLQIDKLLEGMVNYHSAEVDLKFQLMDTDGKQVYVSFEAFVEAGE